MSLNFFFNRRGKVVIGLLFLGWVLSLVSLFKLFAEWKTRGPLTGAMYLLFIFLSFFLTITRFKPWYRLEDRGYGLEEHFEKTLVPLSYILVVVNWAFLVWKNCWPLLLFAAILLGIIQYVNVILIYFHYKDKDPTPPAYLSRSPKINKNKSAIDTSVDFC